MHPDTGPPKFGICINFQCRGPASPCIYSRPKRPTDDQTDRHKITKGPRRTGRTNGWTYILYCHSGDFNLWPVAACAARNYKLYE